jgi:phage terminase large subunit
MKIKFNTNGNDKQKLSAGYWIDNTTTEITYGGAKGTGKSYLGASLIFGDALMYPETMYFIARKSLNDIRKFTIPTINEVFQNWGIDEKYYKFNGQDNYYTTYNGSVVYLLEGRRLPSDPQFMRFGSMQMTRGWIEEAGEFETESANNLKASVGRWKNDKYNLLRKVLQSCNPSKNYLYSDVYRKHKDGTIEGWKKFIQALPTDNKMLTKGYLQQLERSLSKNERERLLYGNWEYDDDPAVLMEYTKILDLFTNTHAERGHKYITADIARLGKDKTVIMVWDGLVVIKIIEIAKSKTTLVVDIIREIQTAYAVPNSHTICDEDGVGGGVVDMLGCVGFVNNSRPFPVDISLTNENKKETRNYANLRSQCYFKLADMVNENKIFLQGIDGKVKDDIAEELEQIKQKDIDKDTKLGIIPKDMIKQNIGRSPDYADSLNMRMYPIVAVKYKQVPRQQNRGLIAV